MTQAENRDLPPEDPRDRRDRRDEQDPDEIDFELDNPEVTSVDGNLDDPRLFPGVEDNPLGFVRVDMNKEDDRRDDRPGGRQAAGDQGGEERSDDFITVGSDVEAIMAEIDNYTDDQEVLNDFAERQETAHNSDQLLNRLREHNSQSPNLSADDIDATWERSDQDIVEELGEAVGILYEDTEPLNTEEKLRQRDRNRWELDPASADSLDREYEPASRFAVLQGAEPEEGEEEIDLVDYLEELEEDDVDEDELDEGALVETLDEDDTEIAGELDDLVEDEEEEDDDDLEGYDDDELDDLDDDFLLGGIDEDDED